MKPSSDSHLGLCWPSLQSFYFNNSEKNDIFHQIHYNTKDYKLKERIFNMDNINTASSNTMTIDLDTQENFTVLKGYFTQVHQIGDGKMVLFKFEGISSYGKLIIEGLTFVGLYEEMLGALKDGIEVTLTGEFRLYKNKRTNEFKVQIEATDILYHD